MATNYTPTRQIWARDFEIAAEAVKPYVIEDEGQQFIDTDCPAPLAEHYSKLYSLGIYHGFI